MPYKYIKLFEEFVKTNNYTYEFKEADINYQVSFEELEEGKFNITYGVLDSEDSVKYTTLNKNNVYRVVNNVVNCIKDFIISNPQVSYIEFFGVPDKKSKTDWILKLFGKNMYLDYMVVLLYDIVTKRVIDTKRTRIFTRWAERESKKMNWNIKKLGNKIILTR
jgi:hypothetical protein